MFLRPVIAAQTAPALVRRRVCLGLAQQRHASGGQGAAHGLFGETVNTATWRAPQRAGCRLQPCQQGVVQAVCLHQQEVHRLPSLSHVDKRAARLRSASKLARQRDRCCSRCASAAPSTASRQLVDSRAGVNGRGDPVIVVTWIPATWLNCSMLGAVIVIVPIACLKSLRCLSNAMR